MPASPVLADRRFCETLWNLDRQGTTTPLTDVVIACCARRIGALLLTFDQHFRQFAGVRAIDRIDV